MSSRSLLLAMLLVTSSHTCSLLAAESIEEVLSATFRVTDKNTSGTCFLVQVGGKAGSTPDRIMLVTAAHGFQQIPGDACWVILRAKQDDGSYARREHRLPLRDGDKPRWKKHPDEDIAVLPIDLPPEVEVTPFRLEQLASARDVAERRVRVAQEAWIPGYPAQLETNPAGWPVLRRGSLASHPLAPVSANKTMLVNVSSFGGDSGAPVVVFPSQNRETDQAPMPLVAGMILGMHRQTDKTVTPFEERTQHTPLDLSIVIQAQLIRETIELLTSPAH